MNRRRYWKNRIPFLLTNLVCMAALTVFLLVCGNSISAVLLILVAWAVVLLTGLFLTYWKRKRQMQKLLDMTVIWQGRTIISGYLTAGIIAEGAARHLTWENLRPGRRKKEVGSRITVILSLHDRWWKKMVSREKLLEIRKTYPHIAPEEWPLRVLVYITGGVGVCGEFNCPGVQKIRTLPEVQSVCGTAGEYNVQAASCLKKEQLKKYAGDSGRPMWGWIISEVQEYEKPVPLEAYGISRPPQSWQYLKTEVEK